MRDQRLQIRLFRNRRLMRVRHDIDERDPIEPDHLLEVDVPVLVAVHVVGRHAEVRPVRVRLEDVAPRGARRLLDRDVQEDGVGAGFEDRVCL